MQPNRFLNNLATAVTVDRNSAYAVFLLPDGSEHIEFLFFSGSRPDTFEVFYNYKTGEYESAVVRIDSTIPVVVVENPVDIPAAIARAKEYANGNTIHIRTLKLMIARKLGISEDTVHDLLGHERAFKNWCRRTGRKGTDPEGRMAVNSQLWFREYNADINGVGMAPERRDIMEMLIELGLMGPASNREDAPTLLRRPGMLSFAASAAGVEVTEGKRKFTEEEVRLYVNRPEWMMPALRAVYTIFGEMSRGDKPLHVLY